VGDLYERQAALILGADLALEHPLLSFQIRANYRHHQARIYVVTPGAVREDKYAAASIRADTPADYFAALERLRDKLKAGPELVVLFDDSFQGADIARLVDFGESLGIPVRYVCLLDYSNSRGAIDMGLAPEFLPGYEPSGQAGLRLNEMLDANLDALWVVGANPYGNGRKNAGADAGVAGRRPAPRAGFLVVQDMFLTETAQRADVVLPAACAYEKEGLSPTLPVKRSGLRARGYHGRQDGPGDHGLSGPPSGSGRGTGPLDAGRRFRGDSRARARL